MPLPISRIQFFHSFLPPHFFLDDITTIGAEFSVVIKSIQRASHMLEAGNTAEVAIQAEKMITLIRVVNESYFVAFSMTPDANLGKARYMLRTRLPALLKELS